MSGFRNAGKVLVIAVAMLMAALQSESGRAFAQYLVARFHAQIARYDVLQGSRADREARDWRAPVKLEG